MGTRFRRLSSLVAGPVLAAAVGCSSSSRGEASTPIDDGGSGTDARSPDAGEVPSGSLDPYRVDPLTTGGYRLMFPGAGTWQHPASDDPYGAINAARGAMGQPLLARDARLETMARR